MSISPHYEHREFIRFLKCVFVIFAIGIIMLVFSVSLRPTEKSHASVNNDCKIEIPSIPNVRFCQAVDDHGIYYYNKIMLVRLP